MIDRALHWIQQYTLKGQGIAVHSRERVAYPEVTGYFIPTLLQMGLRDLAQQYGSWLTQVQKPDGSFGGAGDAHSFAFDTGQVIRGWSSLLPHLPEVEQPLRKACDWLLETSDAATGRLRVPAPGGAWSLGRRGEVFEAIHLYCLAPLRAAGELLDEKRYLDFVHKSLRYYLSDAVLPHFSQPNALTHFFGYVQEALVELGCEKEARRGMEEVAAHQNAHGAVPGYSNVTWVCSTGLAQLAKVWFMLGESQRAEKALDFLGWLQNPSGGFWGSYGLGADYFPAAEISWAVKYAIEANLLRIRQHFDATVGEYQPQISDHDGRLAAVLRHAGELDGKHILDAGCGKGRYSAALKQRFPRAEITAMDISPEMLAHVPPGIKTVRASLLDIPHAPNSFDLVLCVEALEHVVNIQGGIRELSRVLKPGGTLVIIDKNAAKLGALEMPNWEQWFGESQLKRLLEDHGLVAQCEAIAYDRVNHPDGLFLCWTGRKARRPAPAILSSAPPLSSASNQRRLAVIPSDPLSAYAHKSSDYLRRYFNPAAYFDEVYCLSPVEPAARVEHGLNIIPTQAHELARRLSDLDIHVVRAYGGYWACDFACNQKAPGIPVVVSVHDSSPAMLYPSILKADCVLAVSGVVRSLVTRAGVEESRVRDLPNRVDFSRFRPCTDDRQRQAFQAQFPGRYRILHVGRKAPEKNLETLIGALSLLGPEYLALFVGPGPADDYQTLAAQTGVASQCRFLASVPHDELYRYYSFCDCFCTPSRREGFGMVFVEALASGAAVVTSAIAPMSEYIQPGVNGLLVADFENPAALAAAIRSVCTDHNLAATLRGNARSSVTRFEQGQIDQLEAGYYAELCGAAGEAKSTQGPIASR